MAKSPLLTVSALTCRTTSASNPRSSLLVDATFGLAAGERVALVGPSGAGKSTLLRCLLGLPPRGTVTSGRLEICRDRALIFDLAEPDTLAPLRGRVLALVPQRAAASLDPVRRIGKQLDELVALYGCGGDARQLLRRVDLAPEVLDLYPHELSGGMARRVALAMAMAGRPAVILADEPTAGLDPATRDRVVAELAASCEGHDVALLLATHDEIAAARLCSRRLSLSEGRVVGSLLRAQETSA